MCKQSNNFCTYVQAQRFVNIVLLPHVRRDIRDNRRLHFALFQSLKKACYKPDAFYKVPTITADVSIRFGAPSAS